MTDKNAELQYFIEKLHDSRQHWEFIARANEETTQQLQSDQSEPRVWWSRRRLRWFRYEEEWQEEEEEQNGEQEDSANPDIFAAEGVFAARARRRSWRSCKSDKLNKKKSWKANGSLEKEAWLEIPEDMIYIFFKHVDLKTKK